MTLVLSLTATVIPAKVGIQWPKTSAITCAPCHPSFPRRRESSLAELGTMGPAFAGTTRRKYVGNNGAESEPSAVRPSPEIALRIRPLPEGEVTGRDASSVAQRNCHPGESRDPVAKNFGDNPCAMPPVIPAEAGIQSGRTRNDGSPPSRGRRGVSS